MSALLPSLRSWWHRLLFAANWTCDRCGALNSDSVLTCYRCGS